jgi:hypothetical protein
MIAAGTMAVGAYRAYKEFKGQDAPASSRTKGRGTRRRSGESGKQGWFGTPFSIRH